MTDVAASSQAAADRIRWISALALTGIAIARCCIVFAPRTFFDVDPAIDGEPIGGLGPAGSLLLDLLLLLASAAALIGESLAGRSIRWPLIALAVLPAPVVAYHAIGNIQNAWLGFTWVAAPCAAVAAAHLARDARLRILMLALLLAVLGPLLVRAAYQTWVEHPRTVAEFERVKNTFLRDRGWEPGSSQALVFEQRVRSPQPTAWFATTNILATFLAAGLIALAALTIASLRLRMQSGYIGALAISTLAVGIMLAVSGSKGALAAAAVGVVLLTAFTLLPRAGLLSRSWPFVFPLLVISVLAAVIVRGCILPESFANDRSLLFRWHYMQASAAIIAEQPLLGVGPDGFQAAYVLHRPARNPEEVQSAHAMFLDWLATLGIAGTAWIALSALLLIAAARSLSLPSESATTESAKISLRSAALGGIAVTLLALVPAFVIELPRLGDDSIAMRLMGMTIYVALALVIAAALAASSRGALQLAAAAFAALLAVIHSQIEMTFTQPGSAAWMWLLLGIAAAPALAIVSPTQALPARNARAILPTIPFLLVAVVLIFTALTPAWRLRGPIAQAAALIAQSNSQSDTMQAEARAGAADLLRNEARADRFFIQEAARQFMHAASLDPTREKELLNRAWSTIEPLLNDNAHPSSVALGVTIAQAFSNATGDSTYHHRAITLARRMTTLDPRSPTAWKRLGDLLLAAAPPSLEETAEAEDAYRRALLADHDFELDPLRRLPQTDVSAIHAHIHHKPDNSNSNPQRN